MTSATPQPRYLKSGANVKVVQRHLGHSTMTQTLDRYAHLFTEDLEAVAERLDAVWAAVMTLQSELSESVVSLVRSPRFGPARWLRCRNVRRGKPSIT